MELNDMMGAYYLHVNGDLIWKPKAVFYNNPPEEYFEGPFVLKYWIIPVKPPSLDMKEIVEWSMNWLREAYELSENKTRTATRIREICKTNHFPDIVADTIIAGPKVDFE